MNSEEDFYVMPAFVTLKVRDLQASANWYREALGFRVLFEVPGEVVHLRREKYQDVLLKLQSGEEASDVRGRGVSLCLTVGSVANLDRQADMAKQANARVLEGPVDRSWNVRELVVADPDGYQIILNGGPVADIPFSELFPEAK